MQLLHGRRTTVFALPVLFAHVCLAGPIVRLEDGTSIEGLVEATYPQVDQYLGIAYANSPVGDLRWAKPHAAAKADYINATRPAPSCMQNIPTDDPVYTSMFPAEYQPPKNGLMGEDCLRLSVWKPSGHTTAPLPVLVFIHGGAFMGGSETVPYQIPTPWVQRTQNLIVVSLNYRLGVFGFPNAAGLPDQNLGILDQRLAITWVRDHIASFGGDPSRIVLWGQSAGAASVDYQTYAFLDDPIAYGVIMDSGSASMMGGSADNTHSAFNRLASSVGCGNGATQLACLRGKPATDILKASEGTSPGPIGGFGPVADNVLVFSNYQSRANQGLVADIPVIAGMNAQDIGGSQCPAVIAARARVKNGRKAWRYLYSGNFDNVAAKANQGAFHTSELPLLFGTHPDFRGNSTPFEYEVSAAMQDAWYAFINDTTNGLERVGWPAWNVSTPNVRNFGADGKAAATFQDSGASC